MQHQSPNAPAMSLAAQQQLRAAGLTPQQINAAIAAMRGSSERLPVNRPPPNSPLRSPLQMPQMAQGAPAAAPGRVPPGGVLPGDRVRYEGPGVRPGAPAGALPNVGLNPGNGAAEGRKMISRPTGGMAAAPGSMTSFARALIAPEHTGPSGGALPQMPLPLNLPPPGQGGGSGWAENLKQFGFATMVAGERPGASLLGSLGQGGMAAMASNRLQRRDADDRAYRQRQGQREDERMDLARQRAAQGNLRSIAGVGLVDLSDPQNPKVVLDAARNAGRPVNVKLPDGTTRAYRLDDSQLDRALAAGAVLAGTEGSGGATPAQQANNSEIDEARKRLQEIEQKLEPGVSLADEIHRRIGTTDPATGRRILDYNSFLGRTAWQAMQRKVGEDREQARWSRMLINPPEPSVPAGPKELPPGVSTEQPGILDRIGDFFSGDGDTPAPASDDGPRRGRPRGGGRARGRGGARAITAMSISELDDMINERGDNLSPADLKAIQARLAALGE